MVTNMKILEEKAEMLKVLGHPIRLCIVKGLIEQGKNNVSFIQGCMGVPQSTLSQHLAKLKAAGIIDNERKGTEVYYKVSNDKVEKLIEILF